MSARERTLLRLLPLAILLAAGVIGFAGRTTLALLGLALGFAALVLVGMALRRPPGPAPELGPDEASALRVRRERDGEFPAARQLREGRPEVSLLDAVRLVRGL